MRRAALMLAVPAVALLGAGCGSSSSPTTSASAPTTSSTAATTATNAATTATTSTTSAATAAATKKAAAAKHAAAAKKTAAAAAAKKAAAAAAAAKVAAATKAAAAKKAATTKTTTAKMPTTTTAASATPFAVASKTVAGLGTILVNSAGHALYTFAPDLAKKVTCTASCQGVWPPLKLPSGDKATGVGGVMTSLLASDMDPTGGAVVTYDGWPLYTFTGDSSAGSANGQGLNINGGVWYVISTAGKVITAKAS